MFEYDSPGGSFRRHFDIEASEQITNESIIWEGDSDGTQDKLGTPRVIDIGSRSEQTNGRWYRVQLESYNSFNDNARHTFSASELLLWLNDNNAGIDFSTDSDMLSTTRFNLRGWT